MSAISKLYSDNLRMGVYNILLEDFHERVICSVNHLVIIQTTGNSYAKYLPFVALVPNLNRLHCISSRESAVSSKTYHQFLFNYQQAVKHLTVHVPIWHVFWQCQPNLIMTNHVSVRPMVL